LSFSFGDVEGGNPLRHSDLIPCKTRKQAAAGLWLAALYREVKITLQAGVTTEVQSNLMKTHFDCIRTTIADNET